MEGWCRGLCGAAWLNVPCCIPPDEEKISRLCCRGKVDVGPKSIDGSCACDPDNSTGSGVDDNDDDADIVLLASPVIIKDDGGEFPGILLAVALTGKGVGMSEATSIDCVGIFASFCNVEVTGTMSAISWTTGASPSGSEQSFSSPCSTFPITACN